MLSPHDHDDIVKRLYASALGDAPWLDTLAHLADTFRSQASMLQISDAAYTRHRVENHGYSREFQEAFYASGIYANDPRVRYFRSVAPGSIYYDHMLYDVAEMERHPACRASIDALGMKYQLGALLRLPDGIGAMTLLQSEAEGHASEEAIAAYRRLAPHMEQACALGQVLEFRAATQAILLEALACKADGIVLVKSWRHADLHERYRPGHDRHGRRAVVSATGRLRPSVGRRRASCRGWSTKRSIPRSALTANPAARCW